MVVAIATGGGKGIQGELQHLKHYLHDQCVVRHLPEFAMLFAKHGFGLQSIHPRKMSELLVAATRDVKLIEVLKLREGSLQELPILLFVCGDFDAGVRCVQLHGLRPLFLPLLLQIGHQRKRLQKRCLNCQATFVGWHIPEKNSSTSKCVD